MIESLDRQRQNLPMSIGYTIVAPTAPAKPISSH